MSTFTPEQEALLILQDINKETSHTWIATKLGNTFLFLGEWFCYLMILVFIVLALKIPSGEIAVDQTVSEGVTVQTSVEVDSLKQLAGLAKALVIFAGLTMILPAVLFRKVRKKNNKLEKVYNLTNDYLKKQAPATKS